MGVDLNQELISDFGFIVVGLRFVEIYLGYGIVYLVHDAFLRVEGDFSVLVVESNDSVVCGAELLLERSYEKLFNCLVNQLLGDASLLHQELDCFSQSRSHF